ncbi:MAG: hypothetical protein MUD13_00725 [Candidatus Nanopelagicales bacterium]|jgi:hypothetical protein|nr:hypothetical protein [Candidatus Nanopelagicales bacterium]
MARTRPFADRTIELIAVILLGVATVGTAWCGLQSSLWNGQQQDLGAEATGERALANRLFGAALQTAAYDSNVIISYAEAVRAGDTRAQEFTREALMRPELLPFVDRWQATIEAGGPTPNLLEDPEYRASLTGDYQAADARAVELSDQSDEAGSVADTYVVTTVLLAVALFFAGVTSSFRYPAMRMALIAGAGLCVALAAMRLIDLPLAAETAELAPRLFPEQGS